MAEFEVTDGADDGFEFRRKRSWDSRERGRSLSEATVLPNFRPALLCIQSRIRSVALSQRGDSRD